MTTPFGDRKSTTMAMFDKQKSSKQPPEREAKPEMARPAQESPAPTAGSATGSAPRVAMIGQGISVTGDVAAKSDLKVEGRIEGRSVTSSHDVEVAESGIIKASISARVIKIAGAVAGDITGSEKVLITKSGRVQGNIVAPRVQLDDGALFRGSIDMNPAEPANAKKAEPAKAASENGSKPGTGPAPSNKPAAGGANKEPGLNLKSG
ncbi:MAG: polymer-forming cytoskeletal protein [Xanthomonadales bacterium]